MHRNRKTRQTNRIDWLMTLKFISNLPSIDTGSFMNIQETWRKRDDLEGVWKWRHTIGKQFYHPLSHPLPLSLSLFSSELKRIPGNSAIICRWQPPRSCLGFIFTGSIAFTPAIQDEFNGEKMYRPPLLLFLLLFLLTLAFLCDFLDFFFFLFFIFHLNRRCMATKCDFE